jgi:hypothetical protein
LSGEVSLFSCEWFNDVVNKIIEKSAMVGAAVDDCLCKDSKKI